MKVVTKDRTKEGEFDDLPLLAEFGDLVNRQGDRFEQTLRSITAYSILSLFLSVLREKFLNFTLYFTMLLYHSYRER